MDLLKKFMGGGFDDLSELIIRPPKDKYEDKHLGPDKFIINGKYHKRSDFYIYNKRNHKLTCSWWEPYDEERENIKMPCVVYLHGNSSSKAEATIEAKMLLSMNITLFALDFSGCGKSEGDYISLGYYEKVDVECVVKFLRSSQKVSTIGLWGRSMGAVTALMYGISDPTIGGLVLDSPFSSLKSLVEEIAKEKISLPNFVLEQVLSMIKSSVKKKAGFSLDEIEPLEYAKKCFIPCMFLAAKNDDFVKPHHTQLLYDNYAGEKNLKFDDGDHNSIRSKYIKDSIGFFFYNALLNTTSNLFEFKYDINETEPMQYSNVDKLKKSETLLDIDDTLRIFNHNSKQIKLNTFNRKDKIDTNDIYENSTKRSHSEIKSNINKHTIS